MFEEMFKVFVGGESEEELAINRPDRVAAHMARFGVGREAAVAVDDYTVRAQVMIVEEMGKFLDTVPPHLLRYVLYPAVGTASLALQVVFEFVSSTCLLSEMLGDQPMVPNSDKPNCTCPNCVAARQIHAALHRPSQLN